MEKVELGPVRRGARSVPIKEAIGAIPAATALRLEGIPVTRVENMCATGTEALRGAAYAVAAGAVDFALAIGAEKLKDTGYGGLPGQTQGPPNHLICPHRSPARGALP